MRLLLKLSAAAALAATAARRTCVGRVVVGAIAFNHALRLLSVFFSGVL
jgi:hypothetical protein